MATFARVSKYLKSGIKGVHHYLTWADISNFNVTHVWLFRCLEIRHFQEI
jgi:hypothetical protein